MSGYPDDYAANDRFNRISAANPNGDTPEELAAKREGGTMTSDEAQTRYCITDGDRDQPTAAPSDTRSDAELVEWMMQEAEVCYHGGLDGVCPREDGCTAPSPCANEAMVATITELARRLSEAREGACGYQAWCDEKYADIRRLEAAREELEDTVAGLDNALNRMTAEADEQEAAREKAEAMCEQMREVGDALADAYAQSPQTAILSYVLLAAWKQVAAREAVRRSNA